MNIKREDLNNKRVREFASKNKVRLWQIADALNVSEPTITRYLRRELPEEKQDELINVIKEIKGES